MPSSEVGTTPYAISAKKHHRIISHVIPELFSSDLACPAAKLSKHPLKQAEETPFDLLLILSKSLVPFDLTSH